ncbi:hypothetical protein Kpol_1020p8 [Vanderwaltozyma polyspora DSM 70294]|uniref:Cyclin-like domain-containing protein n=1 Tax=Vanderwaltozyma polyspora (strain ATCC 22028 / DSM 70294 / BCRC 21397 / CBS 2163 / NBRC 10782 / NRRL Y-8283 / UCD 57-17) TaxID=436907 RepID=A7TLC1_VANPO|nr:uncharacterized protein Kpol_1020p8 [Vanderwaltozyma polyspora DSM 70294]EDO16902.1 hypothetical protein Kpol_1020p8 [Vanderwaltozyma polyspora DSM 70294]
MSDYEALLEFNKKTVTKEMIAYLSNITESIIQVRRSNSMISIALPPPPLVKFITNLCLKSNVQTPTLMATTVYLKKLKNIIPPNVYGIESTRHRIFLGCLILASKTLNDSSPLNKHWARYTSGILQLREVNTIERELLEYFDWNIQITTDDLVSSLEHFIQPIKEKILKDRHQLFLSFNPPTSKELREYASPKDSLAHSRSSSNTSLPSLTSASSADSLKLRSPCSTNTSNTNVQDNIEIIDEMSGNNIKNAGSLDPSKGFKSNEAYSLVPPSSFSNISQDKVSIKKSQGWSSFFN